MSQTRRRFTYTFAVAGATLAVGNRLFAQRQITAEEAAEQARIAAIRQKAALELVRIGTLAGISGNTLVVVDYRGQSEQLTIDPSVAVWKSKYSRNLQLLQVGDRVMMCGGKDPRSGKLIVTEIWANWDSFSGTIISVSGDRITVELDRKLLDLKRLAEVTHIRETVFIDSQPEDLVTGRGITVAGVVMKDGTLQATTITVFDEFGRPVRMAAGARIINP